FVDEEDVAGPVGCIDCNANPTGERHIFWGSNLGRQRQRRLRRRDTGGDEGGTPGDEDHRHQSATAHLAPHPTTACVRRSCATPPALSMTNRPICIRCCRSTPPT